MPVYSLGKQEKSSLPKLAAVCLKKICVEIMILLLHKMFRNSDLFTFANL